ncbi:MAG TPA: polysaccharide deacetylase family protein [Gemmatimonadales bacterium]|nr:polysaccharide deacetylase family protein [Gemmatimonadales bacterium]
MVHLDLDGYSAICAAHGWGLPTGRDELFLTGLTNALDALAETQVRATLFVIAQDLSDPDKLALLRRAVEQGHEIGSHTVTHRRLTTLSSREKASEIRDSREAIAATLGVPVLGFRAPAFDLDREVIDLVAQAGYRYDSSLFPNTRAARRIGVERVSDWPHRLHPAAELLELPLPRFAPLPVPYHPCYSLVVGTWYFRTGLQRTARIGSPLVLLFHLTDFAEPLAPGAAPGWKRRFFTLSHISATDKRRRCGIMMAEVAGRYQLASTADLLEKNLEAVN